MGLWYSLTFLVENFFTTTYVTNEKYNVFVQQDEVLSQSNCLLNEKQFHNTPG
jgi:hypothetical protein